jgi:alanyl-tRNA synthetase
MQYEQRAPGDRVPLPKPSIDTGMGLERVAAVLQGRHDNYEIDLFQRLIARSVELTGAPYEGERRPSHKVIADHLRASAFLLADGVMPSNEGRGYVLRRIMRRGMRHAHLLGAERPLLWRLVPTLVGEMGDAFPELRRAEALVSEVLKLEETNFRRTLERGLRLLDEATAGLGPGAALPGETAFRLYDTYGFPLDLTQDALRAQGRAVDLAGFETAMERQREAARASWRGSGAVAVEPVWFEIREELGATEFLGYETLKAEGTAVALVVDGRRVEAADAGSELMLVANQTPFYGESGGQQGDSGTIRSGNVTMAVTDTRKLFGDLHVHVGRLTGGPLRIGAVLDLRVDDLRRERLRRSHSATHLLHAALRRHLGRHVAQKGSLVAPDRLRFDFSHTKPVAGDELIAIEEEVNRFIRQNSDVTVRIMDREAAIASGAMALFGEKYGDEVRVVSMGERDDGKPYSVELCGGTHVRRTGDIALCRLIGEGAVASGIRRVEALTGEAALDEIRRERRLLAEAAVTVRAPPAELPARVAALVEERRRLEREVAELRQRLASGGAVGAPPVKQLGAIRFAGRTLAGVPPKDLRGTADAIRKELGSGVVALVGVNDGKAAVVVSVSDDLTGRVSAVELVRKGVAAVGGKGGGGRADFAQGGGPDGAAAGRALAAIEAALAG